MDRPHGGDCHDQLGVALTYPVTVVVGNLVSEDVASFIRRMKVTRNVVVQMRVSVAKHTGSQVSRVASEESRQSCMIVFLLSTGNEPPLDDIDRRLTVRDDGCGPMDQCHLTRT